jgi:hypothetical protein
MELILSESIRVNQEDDGPDHHCTAFIDSTVQEKNVTYPTDAKLHKKIVRKVLSVVKSLGLPLRQSYTFVLKKIYRDQRFRNHPKNRGKALKADKRLRTIAGRLKVKRDGTGGTISRSRPSSIPRPESFGLPPVVTTTMSAKQLCLSSRWDFCNIGPSTGSGTDIIDSGARESGR